ncbi:hypothetical protein [Clavibacter nebraskensis]|uniref:Asp23/Gls24 family envelope stress response protein n=2 Tax=Clavibacter nebraskensis TaxID=31963 RepID=A0A399Q7I8_9MICO|nr:hypothetical protein [Clavibacter nebraskensis]KXU22064.1 hypothetical protein VV38_01775 [Clavibacter nebraskensis]OAH18678.1 hypothetical protein A3Q38_09465 [Clavibacter nebraskensis]QGV65747.1 hypothetical protein EGX36_02140 [Clavibacter nebraskensis]QGV68542.1 hypothetical protein EGX37_02125 [Clavibacter nebraskensis]QGV71333.1 hypothetical protein EGX35_02125 [Clavibacter nebraskensis]
MTFDDDASAAVPAPLPVPPPSPADLSRDLTAVLRGVAGVADVYAPRSPILLAAQQVVEGVVAGSSTATERLVTVETGEGTVLVEASIAVDASSRASDTARAAVDAVRARLAESIGAEDAARAAVTVRIGSIG